MSSMPLKWNSIFPEKNLVKYKLFIRGVQLIK